MHTLFFVAYLAALVAAILFSWLYWRAGNRYAEIVNSRATVRIAEAGAAAREADRRAADAGERASMADERAAAAGKEAATANETAAKANERSQHIEAENLVVRGRVAGLEKQAADARARAAEAERLLAEVNERTKDRHLGATQRVSFLRLLSTAPKGKVRILVLGSEPEPRVFAAELGDALRAAGWEVDDEAAKHAFLPGIAKGVFIGVKDKDHEPLSAGLLQKALGHVGIDAQGGVNPALSPDDLIELVIGSK